MGGLPPPDIGFSYLFAAKTYQREAVKHWPKGGDKVMSPHRLSVVCRARAAGSCLPKTLIYLLEFEKIYYFRFEGRKTIDDANKWLE